MQIKFKKINSRAKLPKFALSGDAGMDLFSLEDKIIKNGQITEIHTGIEIELPPQTVGLIWDKGGVAHMGLKTMGGVIDENYRGEIIIIVSNLSFGDYIVEKGDKVAQLLIQKIEYPKIIEVKKLSESNRGRGRLGSTGMK